MGKFKIGNLWVQFPFVPYPAQEEFMKKMIEAIENSKNALLESPTGTGKTMCLLCGSLAWLDMQRKAEEIPELKEIFEETNPKVNGVEEENNTESDKYNSHERCKIYFCTRTHSQLVQAVQEFQNTSYGHLRSSVLGSRKHLCINPAAKKSEGNVDSKCRTLRKGIHCGLQGQDIEDVPNKCASKCNVLHKCSWYTNYEEMKSSGNDHHFRLSSALDQKGLIEKSKEYNVCPFYVSRHLQTQADIAFLPYSYIFNPHILKGLQLNLKNAIVIIDEGHNLEKVCEENASFEMKASDAANCRSELDSACELSTSKDYPPGIRPHDILELKTMMEKLEFIIKNRIKPGVPPDLNGFHYNGDHCLKFFEEAGISRTSYQKLVYQLKELAEFLSGKERKTDGLKKVHNIISTIFYLEGETTKTGESALKENFVLYKEDIKPEKIKEVEPKVSFWCFDAGIIMKSLKRKGVRSFIVTSGTLSPLQPLRDSLSIPFEVDLLNQHVVGSSQVLSLCMSKAPTCGSDEPLHLNMSYAYREKNSYQLYESFGNVVRETAKYCPKGLLIFFSSTKVKKDCLERWNNVIVYKHGKKMTLLDDINDLKVLFEEPKEASELHRLQTAYNASVQKGSGACLVGVLSGKVSEGIDFKDDLGRAVILIGLPYPPLYDPWVKCKRQHLSKKKGSVANSDWYFSQAIRPVNQALGRIIRHQLDYGCVLFLDLRFSTPNIQSGLPQWLVRNLRGIEFKDLGPELQKFFERMPAKIREIERTTSQEQTKICKWHRAALKKEECHSDKYLDLMVKRDKAREREAQMKVEILRVAQERGKRIVALVALRKKVAEKAAALREAEANLATDSSQVSIKKYDSDCERGGDCEWEVVTLSD